MKMNLYLLKRTDYPEDETPYDSYDSLIVAATTAKDAITISPSNMKNVKYEWTSSDNIKCTFIGTAKKFTKRGIILKSFNAG
jgi:hypothetical protein